MAREIGIEIVGATIASGQSLSGAVKLGALYLVRVQMPAQWTAAVLTFQMSPDGRITFLNVQKTSAEFVLTVAANEYIALDPSQWRGANVLKVRSGTAATPVAQVAQVVVGLVVRPII